MSFRIILLLALFAIPCCGIAQPAASDSFFFNPATKPEFPGGEDKLFEYIIRHSTFPEAAAKETAQGKVFVRLMIDANGRIVQSAIYKSVHPALDSVALAVARSMPDWIPARNGDTTVGSQVFVPFNFRLDPPEPAFQEIMPEFPGGIDSLFAYGKRHLKYPKRLERKLGLQRVQVRFVIDEEGKVCDPEVVKSAHPVLDSLALDFVSSMPRWHPGKQGGRAVKVYFTLPVTFGKITIRPDWHQTPPFEPIPEGRLIYYRRNGSIIEFHR